MANISLEWNWFHWNYGNKWKSDILPELESTGVSESDIDRAVYVIRLNEPFAIKYPQGISPVIYIGEGNLKDRLSSHLNGWINNLPELIEKFYLSIGVSVPRVRNNFYAYKDVEAALIQEFSDIYGSAPLNNQQREYQKISHDYDKSDLRNPLMLGKGSKYKWAIEPMKSNVFHDAFHKTHI